MSPGEINFKKILERDRWRCEFCVAWWVARLHCHQASRLDPAGRLMHWLGVAVILLLTPHAVLLMTAALHCVAARCCCCSAIAVASSSTHRPKTTPAHVTHHTLSQKRAEGDQHKIRHSTSEHMHTVMCYRAWWLLAGRTSWVCLWSSSVRAASHWTSSTVPPPVHVVVGCCCQWWRTVWSGFSCQPPTPVPQSCSAPMTELAFLINLSSLCLVLPPQHTTP